MRKLIVFLVFAFGVFFLQQSVGQSRNDLKNVGAITFYGVDFSLAKIYGSEDTLEKLQNAFVGINYLFEAEPEKFNVSKALEIKQVELFNFQVKEKVNEINEDFLFTKENRYFVTDNEIDNVVRNLKKEGDSQYGAVIVTGLLNKIANQGTFTYVVFEQNTKEVIFQQELTGKPRGFGLRNFWAGALYDTMKKIK